MNRKLSFTLTEESNPLRTRSIVDLCDYLTDKLLVPRFAASGAKWRGEFMDFFTFDNTCDPLQPTGTIYFHVPPLFAGCTASLERAVVDELAKLGIKVGHVSTEPNGTGPGSVLLRIPIVENPTAQLQPPEVNMSRTRGTVVLRDLLHYQPNNGRYEFTAEDLLQRLETVTEPAIALHRQPRARDPVHDQRATPAEPDQHRRRPPLPGRDPPIRPLGPRARLPPPRRRVRRTWLSRETKNHPEPARSLDQPPAPQPSALLWSAACRA